MNYIKVQRLSWSGHADRMTNDMVIKNLYEWKPISTRLAERPKSRWKNGIKEDLRIMKIIIGQNASRIGLNRREVVEKAKTFKH